LIRDVLDDFVVEASERKVVWTVHSVGRAQGDRGLVRMVLVNLISNALKFTQGRPEALIEIGAGPHADDETVVYVRDNGAGFDAKYAGKLFVVFERLHSQAEFVGTGIGLANVQRIVHRHGGRVWAEGAVGLGATFNFSLPAGR
jgi:chemotaxis family two-component system sensor kinase Cph1